MNKPSDEVFALLAMQFIRTGASRWVLLIDNYAVKIPSLYSYRNFLHGLLGNHQEKYWFKELGWCGKLCPVLWSSWGNLINIMPRAEVLSDHEFLSFYETISHYMYIDDNSLLPVEHKSDSFGVLNGRIVAIDYGS